jgi:hypothetical protein
MTDDRPVIPKPTISRYQLDNSWRSLQRNIDDLRYITAVSSFTESHATAWTKMYEEFYEEVLLLKEETLKFINEHREWEKKLKGGSAHEWT